MANILYIYPKNALGQVFSQLENTDSCEVGLQRGLETTALFWGWEFKALWQELYDKG